MKNIFIMGDSYSTYKGYNPKGYNFYYYDGKEAAPSLSGVEKTWWHQLAAENDLHIVCNDSFSGSTVCNTVREVLPVESSFINRMDKYIAEGFFEENKIDTMIIFGGTNDSWINAPIGKVQYSDYTPEDLKCVLPAFCYLTDKAKRVAEKVLVVINSDLKEEITTAFAQICDKNEIGYLLLCDIDKENGHPTELGMAQIAKQIEQCL